jgi:hypothetical protein
MRSYVQRMTMLTGDVISDETAAAIAAAGIEPERVLVHVHQRAYVPNGRLSGHYRPGQPAEAGDELGLDADDLARLNAHDALQVHRVVLYADYGLEPGARWVFAGLLRHELEHARQFDALGGVAFELSQLIDTIHEARFGTVDEEKYLYRAKPDEQDANAAAATYLSERFGDEALERLHTDAWYPLVWSHTRAELPETLIRRSVCFLFQYFGLCEHLAGEQRKASFAAWLSEIDAEAAALWRALTA